MMDDQTKLINRINAEEGETWRKWVSQIPFIAFEPGWEVAVIPPFAGALVRFLVRLPNTTNSTSVYLDVTNALGYYDGPYWEVYPHDDDVFRCGIDETDRLVGAIKTSLEQINER